MRDNQRQKLYDWEVSAIQPFDRVLNGAPTLDADRAQKFCQVAYDRWVNNKHNRQIKITTQGNRGRGCAVTIGLEIRLPTGWDVPWTDWYLLHETAHLVVGTLYWGRNVADHGPEFVRVYMEMLSWWYRIPKAELRSSRASVKLKELSPSKLKPACKIRPRAPKWDRPFELGDAVAGKKNRKAHRKAVRGGYEEYQKYLAQQNDQQKKDKDPEPDAPSNVVTIFDDPITKTRVRGEAVLIEKIGPAYHKAAGVDRWKVRWEDGSEGEAKVDRYAP